MSVSSSDIWQRIVREQLASPEECRQWAEYVAQQLPTADQSHPLKLLKCLVDGRRLTAYQARILAGRSQQPLRLGSWAVIGPVPDPHWKRWLVVRPPATQVANQLAAAAGKTPLRWACCLDTQQLQTLRPAVPSLSRVQQLAEVRQVGVQAIDSPQRSADQLLLTVAPLQGRWLWEQYSTQRCSVELAWRIVRQVAESLAALHARGIAHGRVLPDRLLVHKEQVILAVDPLCSATSMTGGLLEAGLEEKFNLQMLAPEFQIPGNLPTPASDVYSLGCVWWWLLTGQPPATGKTAEQIWQQHSHVLPPVPEECGLPAAQELCLQHALGRTAASRFASAAELCRAMQAVERGSVTPGAGTPGAVTAGLGAAGLGAAGLGAAGPQPLRSRRRRPKWLWAVPLVATAAVVAIGLGLAVWSGLGPGGRGGMGEQHASRPGDGSAAVAGGRTTPPTNAAAVGDPRQAAYQVVANDPQLLWLPPAVPTPLPLDLLPPGGQMFLALRPAELLQPGGPGRELLASFEEPTAPLLDALTAIAGVPLEQLKQVTTAWFAPMEAGGMPRACLRFELVAPRTLEQLQTAWDRQLVAEQVGDQQLLRTSAEWAYYVASQPLLGSQAVTEFSAGPLDLMRDAAELRGQAGPLFPHMERLWRVCDQQSEVVVFAAVPFLVTEGRPLMRLGPPRLDDLLQEVVDPALRGLAVQMRLTPKWYTEIRLLGSDDQRAGQVLAQQQQRLQALPAAVESQLVRQTPDVYWRALAVRYPQMLRTLVRYTRFGVEQGTAVLNAYLPSKAAHNVLLASWLAVQDIAAPAASPSATSSSAASLPAGDNPAGNNPANAGPPSLDIEAYLAQAVNVSFEQEPIEGAWELIAEEANARQPAGSPPVPFVLDGAAFEKAGITRNQQIRDFRSQGQPLRNVLTELAKRGNPVANVSDLRDPQQRLVWVVVQPSPPAATPRIQLTTRAAAEAGGVPLPDEFRP